MPLFTLTDEELVRAALDPLTRRDLIEQPPAVGETMQQLGVSATNLDGPVRSWINGRFRGPRGLSLLTRGKIKSETKWSQLVQLLTQEATA